MFANENLSSLQRNQKLVTKLVSEYKCNYEDEMSATLDKKLGGVPQHEFDTIEATCRVKALKEFQLALLKEPSKLHIQTLIGHIEKTKDFYWEENADKLKISIDISAKEHSATRGTETPANPMLKNEYMKIGKPRPRKPKHHRILLARLACPIHSKMYLPVHLKNPKWHQCKWNFRQ